MKNYSLTICLMHFCIHHKLNWVCKDNSGCCCSEIAYRSDTCQLCHISQAIKPWGCN